MLPGMRAQHAEKGCVVRKRLRMHRVAPVRGLAEIATTGKRVVLKSALLSMMRVRAPLSLPSSFIGT